MKLKCLSLLVCTYLFISGCAESLLLRRLLSRDGLWATLGAVCRLMFVKHGRELWAWAPVVCTLGSRA